MSFIDRIKLTAAKYNNSTCKTSDDTLYTFSKNKVVVGKLDKNGRKTGLWITTIHDRVIESATYLDGQLNGPYSSSWNEDVDIINCSPKKMIVVEAKGGFSEGLKEGMWTEGKASGHYTNDLRTGFWQIPAHFDELIKGHYADGVKTGVWEGANSRYAFSNDAIIEAKFLSYHGVTHERLYQNGVKINSKRFDHTGYLISEECEGQEISYWKDWIVTKYYEKINSFEILKRVFQKRNRPELFDVQSIRAEIPEPYTPGEDHFSYLLRQRMQKTYKVEITITDGINKYSRDLALNYASIYHGMTYLVPFNEPLPLPPNHHPARINRVANKEEFIINGHPVVWDSKNKIFK